MANRQQRRQAAKKMGTEMPENITIKQLVERYNQAVMVMARTIVPIMEVMTQTFNQAQEHLRQAGLLDEDGNLTETARKIMYNEEGTQSDTDQTVETSDQKAGKAKK